MTDQIFKKDAKQMVDMMFDSGMLREDVTRDDMNTFEELIEFLLTSRFETYKRCHGLLEKIKLSKS